MAHRRMASWLHGVKQRAHQACFPPDAPNVHRSFHTALIQGCDRGIGLEMVHQLLKRNPSTRVLATVPDPMGAVSLAALKDQSGGRLEIVALDVRSETSIQEAAREVQEKCSKLDLLVNVSGIFHVPNMLQPETTLKDVHEDAARLSFAVNATGPLLVMKHMLPLLVAGGSSAPPSRPFSVIANVSSRSGSIADNHLGGFYSYRASKAALNQLTKTAAQEFAARHLPIVAVLLYPGTVDTDLTRPFIQQLSAEKVFSKEFAVQHMLSVLDNLQVADNGRFLAWDGSQVAW